MILAAVLFMLTAIGIALAPEPGLLSCARLIGGLGVGIASMVVPLYIAETFAGPSARADGLGLPVCDHHRGPRGLFLQFRPAESLPALARPVGRDSSLSLDGRGAGVAGHAGHLVFAGGRLSPAVAVRARKPALVTKQDRRRKQWPFSPESPAAARPSIRWSRSARPSATKREISVNCLRRACGGHWAWPSSWPVSGQLSGINAIVYYGPTIFKNAGFTMGNALSGQVILGVVNVAFTLLVLWKVDTLGRRPLLLAGNSGVFLGLLMVGVSFATHADGHWLVFGSASSWPVSPSRWAPCPGSSCRKSFPRGFGAGRCRSPP